MTPDNLLAFLLGAIIVVFTVKFFEEILMTFIIIACILIIYQVFGMIIGAEGANYNVQNHIQLEGIEYG